MALREENHNTLKGAIERLPAYMPPDGLWSSIEEKLAEAPLRDAIRKLPTYQPADTVWSSIEGHLQKGEEQTAVPPTRLPRIRPIWISVAAAVLLALLSLWWVMPLKGPEQPSVQITYSQETTPPPFPAFTSEGETPEVNAILSAYEERPFLQTQTDYQRLRDELHELTRARESLQKALRRYGQDGDLYRQLGRIERDRDRIIKQLAAAI